MPSNWRPGIARENVTTEGIDVNGLAVGQRLQIGEVELQLSAVLRSLRADRSAAAGAANGDAGPAGNAVQSGAGADC